MPKRNFAEMALVSKPDITSNVLKRLERPSTYMEPCAYALATG